MAKVSLPIEILPKTFVGEVDVDCFGSPASPASASPAGSCRVVITQRIKIKIPYKIGVKAITGCSNIFCFPLGCEEDPQRAEDEKGGLPGAERCTAPDGAVEPPQGRSAHEPHRAVVSFIFRVFHDSDPNKMRADA